MTPEEKALSLYSQYLLLVRGGMLNETYHHKAKQAATICVDEILEVINDRLDDCLEKTVTEYWEQVRHKIQRL
jgi:hypothetical protein